MRNKLLTVLATIAIAINSSNCSSNLGDTTGNEQYLEFLRNKYMVLENINKEKYELIKGYYPDRIEDQDLIFDLTFYIMDYQGVLSDSDARTTDAYWCKDRSKMLWIDSRNGMYIIKNKNNNTFQEKK